MIPQYTSDGDMLSFQADTAAPDTFADTLMVAATEEVVTTEPSDESSCQCKPHYLSTIPQIASIPRSSQKRPTSLMLDNDIKRAYNKTIQRDLSIFSSEEPHIFGDSKSCLQSGHKSFDFISDMDVAAQEEVVTDFIYSRPLIDIGQLTDITECTSEILSDDNTGSNESSSTDRPPSLEDNLKTCLPMTPDTEKALVTFACGGDTDVLLPIVKCGPGFDLIDFINNDFPGAEVVSSPSNLKRRSYYSSSSNKKYGKISNENSIPKIKRLTRLPKRESPQYLYKKTLSKKVKKPKTSLRSHFSNYKSLRTCNLQSALGNSKLYWDKRIKNNLSSKISREKRKRDIQLTFKELELLRIKNYKLLNNELNLKSAIKKLQSIIVQLKVDKSNSISNAPCVMEV